MSAQKVIVDADPAIGYAFRDVDDGLALLYLLAWPDELDVLGVTSVHGNASLKRTTAKAEEVLGVAGRGDVPVLRGARGRRDLASSTPASLFMVDAVLSDPGNVTVLALGPLTNVAAAGLTERSFFEKVARVVMMGGALEEGFGIPLVSPLEFNFFKDPGAADIIIGAPCEKILITADLCKQVVFTRRELQSLWGIDHGVSTYLAYRIEPWLKINTLAPFLPWNGGFVPWDVVAAVYLRRPELFTEVEERGMRLRRGYFTTGGLESCPENDDRAAIIPTRVKPRPLLDEFLQAISMYST